MPMTDGGETTSELLNKWMAVSGLPVRQAAEWFGVSHSHLFEVMKGKVGFGWGNDAKVRELIYVDFEKWYPLAAGLAAFRERFNVKEAT